MWYSVESTPEFSEHQFRNLGDLSKTQKKNFLSRENSFVRVSNFQNKKLQFCSREAKLADEPVSGDLNYWSSSCWFNKFGHSITFEEVHYWIRKKRSFCWLNVLNFESSRLVIVNQPTLPCLMGRKSPGMSHCLQGFTAWLLVDRLASLATL